MYYFDTYALFEVLQDAEAYRPYADAVVFTSVLNLGELYYGLMARLGRSRADALLARMVPSFLEVSLDAVKAAMRFRLAHRGKRMSHIDCIGYAVARENRLRFLTRDEAFRGLPGVEFVK